MGHEETLVTNWMWGAVEPVKEEVRRNLRSPACEIRQVVVCFSKSNEKGRVWEKGIMNSVLKKKRYVLGYQNILYIQNITTNKCRQARIQWFWMEDS